MPTPTPPAKADPQVKPPEAAPAAPAPPKRRAWRQLKLNREQLKDWTKALPALLLVDHLRALENLLVLILAGITVYFVLTIHFQAPQEQTVRDPAANAGLAVDRLQSLEEWLTSRERHIESGLDLRRSVEFSRPPTGE